MVSDWRHSWGTPILFVHGKMSFGAPTGMCPRTEGLQFKRCGEATLRFCHWITLSGDRYHEHCSDNGTAPRVGQHEQEALGREVKTSNSKHTALCLELGFVAH